MKEPAEITLRDYFAAKAMQSLITVAGWEGISAETISGCAYEQADTMLAERNKGREEE